MNHESVLELMYNGRLRILSWLDAHYVHKLHQCQIGYDAYRGCCEHMCDLR